MVRPLSRNKSARFAVLSCANAAAQPQGRVDWSASRRRVPTFRMYDPTPGYVVYSSKCVVHSPDVGITLLECAPEKFKRNVTMQRWTVKEWLS